MLRSVPDVERFRFRPAHGKLDGLVGAARNSGTRRISMEGVDNLAGPSLAHRLAGAPSPNLCKPMRSVDAGEKSGTRTSRRRRQACSAHLFAGTARGVGHSSAAHVLPLPRGALPLPSLLLRGRERVPPAASHAHQRTPLARQTPIIPPLALDIITYGAVLLCTVHDLTQVKKY